MVEIKLHRNEIEKIIRAIESSSYFGNDKKLCDRILDKLDKALSKSSVGQSFCECSQAKGVDIDEDGYPYCIECQKNVAKC